MKPPRLPTDLRRLRLETNRRMLGLTIFVLVIIGSGVIAIAYGASAALTGLGCLLAGAGVIGLLWLLFTLIGRWAGEE